MHGSRGDVAIEVPFDEHLFLAVPIELRGPSADGTQWAREQIETLQVQPDRVSDLNGVIAQLAGQASLLSPQAFAAFLFCPSGLPGSALVEVFIGRTERTSLADVTVSYPVALPQREHPIYSPSFGTGRAISSLSKLPDGTALGQIRYQHLDHGILVDMSVTASDLTALGAGMPAFEALVNAVSCRPADAAAHA
ncbi:hypothetical protein PTQ19_01840 [Microbacterium esteraromaticum]|uniref:hypothetical protein n=1 Tax=Microbacterium esteraromaticum TaxID=57043 RepID=UPI002368C40A|nr:hypothetical protein [Microbacterium esteraromaticum]WDH79212.1 hypothetical protein PTQ19_01840 [Microbacterium esteraromaticum]